MSAQPIKNNMMQLSRVDKKKDPHYKYCVGKVLENEESIYSLLKHKNWWVSEMEHMSVINISKKEMDRSDSWGKT